MPLTRGQILHGRYEIQSSLGHGGMGAVYRAHDQVLNHSCAIKELVPPPGLSDSQVAGMRQQFREEAQVLANLDHPSLPHVIDYFSESATEYLVMDFVHGVSLDRLIATEGERGLEEERVLDWAAQLLEALAHCHAYGVIHRDVKPSNIIIRPDTAQGPNGRAVLVDFGLVKQRDAEDPTTRTAVRGLGTPEYAPPEQYHSGPGHTDPRSDLYSLGATLYHALTGKPPPSAATRMATPDQFQKPRSIRRSISPRMEAVILRAMELPLDRRFKSAEQMASSLFGTALLSGYRLTRNAKKRRPAALRFALALVLGLVLVGGLVAAAYLTDWPMSWGALTAFFFTDTPTATLQPSSTPAPAWTATQRPPTSTPRIEPSPTPPSTSTPRPSSTSRPTATHSPTVTPSPTRTPRVEPTRTTAPTSTPRPPSTPLTTATEAASSAAGVPSGRIAFTIYNAGIGSYSLYTLKLGESSPHPLANYVHQPDFTPDGKRIVVDGVGGDKNDLWHFRFDGTDWVQLTTHPDDRFPTWSKDGQLLSFSSARQGDGVYRLYLWDASGDYPLSTSTTPLTIGDYPILMPNWEVVFQGCDYGWGSDTRCGLWRVSPGHLPAALTDNPQDVPTDGSTDAVLFLRPDGDNWEIYRIGATGGSPVRLTNSPGRDGPAAFSPDGRTIAFLSERSGAWALYTMDWQGGNVKKLLDLPQGGNFDAGPHPWSQERISWGPLPSAPTPVPTVADDLLPAPVVTFPLNDSTVTLDMPLLVQWDWPMDLAFNQGFQVRFWHITGDTPAGITPIISERQVEVNLGDTDAYRRFGESHYYLDVIVAQLSPFKVLSRTNKIRIRVVP